MKIKSPALFVFILLTVALTIQAAEPLRVFIRGGKKSHGPGQHEHEQFLKDWTKLLRERGAVVDGAMEFPGAAQLEETDVLILHSQEGGEIPAANRPGMEAFLKRGGGVVVIHAASVPKNGSPDGAAYLKSVVGGSWVWGTTKWLEGKMSLYYVDRTHAITTGVANYDMNDEIYYDMDLSPDIRVLAAAYTPKTPGNARPNGLPQAGKISVYDIQPQMWTYESKRDGGQPFRAFVHIPGHLYKNFSMPHFRAVLLRGIAWAGKRANADELCKPDELASLRYPEGGPSHPEKSLPQIAVHPDFKMTLVASEPLVNKVMNVDWDAQGRMWVCETPEYPDGRFANRPGDTVQHWIDGKLNPETGRFDRPAFDRICILSQPNADGIFRKKKLFADFQHGVPGGIELVTSFAFYKDGVIISAAPDILWLRDTNGDDVCDKVEKLYTNLGTRDTHSLINNLRLGFDGWVYATHGYSSSPNVTTGNGSKGFGTIGSGLVRFKPDGTAFEQVSSKGGNTWGLQVTWDNELFWTQPTSGDLLMNTVLPEGILSRGKVTGTPSYKVVRRSPKIYPLIPYDQLPYVQIDWVGSFTAAAGTVVYDGGSWPVNWNYSYFCTEPTVNLVHHEVVKPEGVSYTMTKVPEREEVEFIAGRDMWFRPIEVRTGPDGAMYVVDFYNQAVIHNDTRGTKHGPRNAAIRPDRDHYYARIWRVDHKDAKKLQVPNLAKASSADLVRTLENQNTHVRMKALQLLVEGNKADAVPALKQLVTSQKEPAARVAGLWAMARLNKLDDATFNAVASDANPALRKNVMRVAAAQPASSKPAQQAALRNIKDSDPQVRLAALVALQNHDLDDASARALVAAWTSLDDNWSQSAFLGIAAKAPEKLFAAALASPNAAQLGNLTARLGPLIASSANNSAALIVSLAAAPASANPVKAGTLESLSAALKLSELPTWSDSLKSALQTLAASSDARVSAAALPFIAKWDTGGSLKGALQAQIKSMLAKLGDGSQSDDARVAQVTSLLGMRQANTEILPAVTQLLGSTSTTSFQRRVIEALGEAPDAAVGAQIAGIFPKLNPELQSAAFDLFIRRAEWSLALLDALKAKSIDSSTIGPANLYRLRTHPVASVATRARTVLDELRGPEAKEKQALVDKLVHEVEKPGNVAKGRELYTANCATCHKLGTLGNEVGPNLTGMGAHGPAELLTAILDPNREVDLSFVAISIETRDGEAYDGIVVRQNQASVVLKNAAGEKDIPRANIKSQRNTGRSLMPEGLEALGAEGLRDILAFVCEADARFRFIDLAGAMTADTRNGLYNSSAPDGGTLSLSRFGVISALGVPFNLIDPARNAGSKNIMVLKGGVGLAKRDMPRKVEARVGFAAKQLHFLGNVGGWGHPLGGGNVPVLKVTVHYTGGKTEELIFKNGEEFADYIREIDVPGSKLVQGIAREGKQVRFASRKLSGSGVIDKLTFESYDNGVAPTTLAVTADLSSDPLTSASATATGGTPTPVTGQNSGKGKGKGKGKQAANPPPVQVASAAGGPVASSSSSAAPLTWGSGTKVLLVGGGSSHDFHRFFNLADLAILKAAGFSANYTESGEVTARELKNVDTAVLSVNTPSWATPECRKALFDFANAGKGLVLLHAGIWYNFKDWPEYNLQLVGGGTRGHDKLGEFSVNVLKDHPITKGVTKSFKITDELYYMTPDPEGAAIEVLAETSNSIKFMKPHPSVFLVKHSKARIVGIALGHDAMAHDLPEFKTLLNNSVKWTAGK